MPQTKAAAKALRTGARRRQGNDNWRRQMRESLHTIRDALGAKDTAKATEAIKSATSILDRAARRHIIHRNKAARKKSQLQKLASKIA